MAYWLFGGLGIVAIAAGGLVSAFGAHRTSRRLSWAVAYIVLVTGLLQLGFAFGLTRAVPNAPFWSVVWAFVTYNLGNAAVLVGTICHDSPRCRGLVDIGGCLLAVSMMLLLFAAWEAPASWELIIFFGSVLVVLVTMPIGLLLSRRHET